MTDIDKDEEIRVLKNIINEYRNIIDAYEARFRNIIEKNADGIMILDESGIIIDVNPSTVAILGRSWGDLVSCRFGIPAIEGETAEISIIQRDRKIINAEMRVVEIDYEWKKAYLVSIRDISGRKRMEEALKESEEKFRIITMTAMDAILVINEEDKVIFSNPASELIFNYQEAEIRGHSLPAMIAPERFRTDYQKFLRRLRARNKKVKKVVELTARRKDGNEFPIEIALSTLKIKGTWHAVCIIRDITEHVRLREELEKISMVDDLTGLLNRRGFFTLAKQQFKLAKRRKKLILLLFMDLDYLKYINDTYGHQEGDRALLTTASILRSTFRETDLIARMGGDEFVMLVTDASRTGDEAVIVNRLKDHLQKYNDQSKHPYTISLSLGVVISRVTDKTSLEKLIVQADELMYEQKQKKKKRDKQVNEEKQKKTGEGGTQDPPC